MAVICVLSSGLPIRYTSPSSSHPLPLPDCVREREGSGNTPSIESLDARGVACSTLVMSSRRNSHFTPIRVAAFGCTFPLQVTHRVLVAL